ncbi:hypothetical protein Taro_053236 [Colocasia esculenta]|uniref:Flavonoid 3'-hydroxylase n=1 Tax=Colocasia esculenta TaxID=4460 RepID=A0A843XMJ5_COLES|nr:hypothetical protein [Colocasia esculenta]
MEALDPSSPTNNHTLRRGVATSQPPVQPAAAMDSPLLLQLPTIAIASLLLLLLVPRLLRCLLSGSRRRLPPGPRGWPVLGNLPHLGPKPHQTLSAMARTYGPLFHLRLGYVDVVVAASPEMASLFLKTHDANFCNRPPNTGAWYMAYGYQDLVWAPYGPLWRMLRKICTHHLFSPKALDDSAAVRREELAELAGSLAASAGQVVELGEPLTVCTANILTRAMLGRRMFVAAGGAKGYEEARQFKEMTIELNTLAGVFMVGDFVPALRWMNSRGETVARMRKVAQRYDEFLDRVIEKHLASEQHHDHDMLRVLVGLKGDTAAGEGAQLTDTVIKALLLVLLYYSTAC